MSVVDFILSGANLPFVVALGVGVLYVLVSASGVASLLGGDAHGDGDGGAGDAGDADADGGDGDAHGDADADGGDADAHGDADADGGDADADGGDADADHAPHAHASARSVAAPRATAHVGGGKLPLSVRGPIALVVIGVTGLGANALLFAETAAVPLYSLAWTAPLAIAASALGGRLLSRALAPILDDRASAATSRRELVGCYGTVISSAVRADFGEVRFRDRSGHLVRLVVKLAEGAPPLAEGDEAVVVELDPSGTPLVARLDVTPP